MTTSLNASKKSTVHGESNGTMDGDDVGGVNLDISLANLKVNPMGLWMERIWGENLDISRGILEQNLMRLSMEMMWEKNLNYLVGNFDDEYGNSINQVVVDHKSTIALCYAKLH
jgi:hypothetical protein